MKRVSAIVAAMVLGWVGLAQAGPLDLNSVPADAKWVAHLDLDAARASPVVQKFIECGKGCPLAKEKLSKLRQKLGLEHWRDLHGVTVYGTKLEPRSGVLILRGKWNVKALQEAAEKAPDHKTSDIGSRKVHSFTAHKGTRHAHEVAAALQKPDVLVLASGTKMLKSALQVLDAQGSSMAGKDSPVAAKVPQGAVALVRAVDLKDSKLAQWHPGLELVKSFSYVEGQHKGNWFGNANVIAESHPVAEKVAKVVEGHLAWLSLHGHQTPWFVELMEKVKVNVDGNAVKLSFQEPADRLASHVPELCKALQEHVKMHMERMQMHCKMMEQMHKAVSHGAGGKAAKDHPACPMMKKEKKDK